MTVWQFSSLRQKIEDTKVAVENHIPGLESFTAMLYPSVIKRKVNLDFEGMQKEIILLQKWTRIHEPQLQYWDVEEVSI